MTDFTDPSGASIRLSNSEREQAVASLEAQAREGRLTDAELATRSAEARSAVTRGDLAPLFADLPSTAADSTATGSQGGTVPPSAALGGSRDPDRAGAARYSGRARVVAISIAPFVALILFFLTSLIWGFAYSWLWFLLVPITGIILYSDGGSDRNRNRDRDR